MPQFINFYENIPEAKIRLEKTIVLYNGTPYYLFHVSDYKGDGKFRVFLDNYKGGLTAKHRLNDFPRPSNYNPDSYAGIFDEWAKNHGEIGIIRKEMGSPKFNNFRPFPLGNINTNGGVVYSERTPTRNTFQGLKENMVTGCLVRPVPDVNGRSSSTLKAATTGDSNVYVRVEVFGLDFYDCMLNNYPTPQEILESFKDPEVTNSGVAFHREFSIFRGPLDLLFLCYQNEGIGILPDGSMNNLIIGNKFSYLLETIQELSCFQSINVK